MEKSINELIFSEYPEDIKVNYKKLCSSFDKLQLELLQDVVERVYREGFKDGQKFEKWLG